ncbi:MAG: hypothetical protein R3B47_00830 [Bacteroidia bacterium]
MHSSTAARLPLAGAAWVCEDGTFGGYLFRQGYRFSGTVSGWSFRQYEADGNSKQIIVQQLVKPDIFLTMMKKQPVVSRIV